MESSKVLMKLLMNRGERTGDPYRGHGKRLRLRSGLFVQVLYEPREVEKGVHVKTYYGGP